jgi:hypothetical protein
LELTCTLSEYSGRSCKLSVLSYTVPPPLCYYQSPYFA